MFKPDISNFFTKFKKDGVKGNLEKLKDQLAEENYLVVDVPADGNCMFTCLARQLGRIKAALEIRVEIVQYLKENLHLLQNVQSKPERTAYLEKMEKAGEWGDGIMLSAAAKLFERTILVYMGDGAKPIRIGTDKTNNESHETIRLGYINNNHYVSIEKPGILAPAKVLASANAFREEDQRQHWSIPNTTSGKDLLIHEDLTDGHIQAPIILDDQNSQNPNKRKMTDEDSQPPRKKFRYSKSQLSAPSPAPRKKEIRLPEFRSHNTMSCARWKEIAEELKNEGKTFNTGRFTNEENKQLIKNWNKIIQDCPFDDPVVLLRRNLAPGLEKDIKNHIEATEFYVKLGRKINRPIYSIYNRARKLFKPSEIKGSFTQNEVDNLLDLVEKYGKKWERIGIVMNRTGQSCCAKFREVEKKSNLGPWTEEETYQLEEAVVNGLHGESFENSKLFYYNVPWEEIAKNIPTRTAKQCRQRWLEKQALLDTSSCRYRFFSKLKQARLIEEIVSQNALSESEINWFNLMNKFENIPSPQYLQKRWMKLKAKVPNNKNLKFNEILTYLKNVIHPVLLLEASENNSSCVNKDCGM